MRIITLSKRQVRRHVGYMKSVVINLTVCVTVLYLYNTGNELTFCVLLGADIAIPYTIFIIGFPLFVCVVSSVNCNSKSDTEFER
jgi:hypothetical protein